MGTGIWQNYGKNPFITAKTVMVPRGYSTFLFIYAA